MLAHATFHCISERCLLASTLLTQTSDRTDALILSKNFIQGLFQSVPIARAGASIINLCISFVGISTDAGRNKDFLESEGGPCDGASFSGRHRIIHRLPLCAIDTIDDYTSAKISSNISARDMLLETEARKLTPLGHMFGHEGLYEACEGALAFEFRGV